MLAAALRGVRRSRSPEAAFQGLFRNPLVSTDIFGWVALGAVVGIYFSLGVLGIECLAFLGGLVAVAGVYLIGTLGCRRATPILIVRVGVSGVGLMKSWAIYDRLPAMTFWLLGSLAVLDGTDLISLFSPW